MSQMEQKRALANKPLLDYLKLFGEAKENVVLLEDEEENIRSASKRWENIKHVGKHAQTHYVLTDEKEENERKAEDEEKDKNISDWEVTQQKKRSM